MTPAEQRDRYQTVLAHLTSAFGYLEPELGDTKEAQKRVLAAFNLVEELRNALVKAHPDVWKDPLERLERRLKEKRTGQRLA